MLCTTRIIPLLFLLTGLKVASSARFKIAIPPREEMSSVQTHSFRRAGSACDDYQLVTDTSGLNFPPGFEHLQKPWENPNTIVVTSETVDLGMNTLFSERVYTWSRWCNHPGCNFSFSST